MIKKFTLLILFFIPFFLFSAKAEINNNFDYLNFEVVAGIKNFAILKHFNNLSKVDRVINDENRRYLGANLVYNEEIIPISIRQDGLGEEHFDNPFISQNTYKIRMKNGAYFQNMQEFRIVSAQSVRHDIPIYANKLLDVLNLPNPKQILAKIDISQDRLNKSSLNKIKYTHIIEESIKDDFLDRNYLREGILFKRDIFNSDGIKILQNCRKKIFNDQECDSELKKRIDGAKIRQINKFQNIKQADHAFKIFNEYSAGLKDPNEVFDYDNTIDLFIFHSIWNNGHSLLDHNVKFYYDPISRLITPIPTDFFHPMPVNEQLANKYLNYQLDKKLIIPFNFDDWEFSSEIEYFYRFSNGEQNWFDYLVQDLNFQKQYFTRLKNLLTNDAKVEELRNVNFEIFAETNDYYSYIKSDKEISFVNVFNSNLTNLINYLESSELQKIIKKKYNIFEEKLEKEKQSYKNDYLEIDHKNKIITLKNKKIQITESIIIPRIFNDYEFLIRKGEQLALDNNAKLTIHSKFNCNNKESKVENILNNDEITISSNHKSDSYLLFMGPETFINNCKFIGFQTRSKFLTGAITFYKTKLAINDSYFNDFDAEDMINVVYSDFKIKNTVFNNSTSDLIDIDVGIGELDNVMITNCGNDCLDFSGSKVNANNLQINSSVDKGISVGEETILDIDNLNISNCGDMCIAVKDSSHLNISDSSFSNGTIGIASYIKKGIYNRPSISTTNVQFQNIQFNIENDYKLGL